MVTLRPANERGHVNHGWLNTYHTFSFARYYDPEYMGYSALRVINEDMVVGGQGFGMHPHQDMEILTYILDGELEHRDSMGNGSVISKGDVQRMSAGSGVVHSEFNAHHTNPVHLLQIWILPEQSGLEPSYEERKADGRRGVRVVASGEAVDGAVRIHQDAVLHLATLGDDGTAEVALSPGRRAWVHVATGEINLNGIAMKAGDGAAVEAEALLRLSSVGESETLVFDLS